MNPTHTQPPAELTALADGSLDSSALLQHVARSPELRAELEAQSRAVAALRTVELVAPAGLRVRIEAERDRARTPRRRRRLALGGCVAAGLAAAALALALALPSAGPGAPTVVQAAQLAQLPAAAARGGPRARPSCSTRRPSGSPFRTGARAPAGRPPASAATGSRAVRR